MDLKIDFQAEFHLGDILDVDGFDKPWCNGEFVVLEVDVGCITVERTDGRTMLDWLEVRR